MRIAIRTDASIQIGSGHVMRCLTLAEALRTQGAEILFICRELAGNLNDLIADKGFELCRLPEPAGSDQVLDWNRHASWLQVPWEQDANETLASLASYHSKFDWLIVDHYALDIYWEEMLRPRTGKVMVIDDLADRAHNCDLLLDQNLYDGMEQRYDQLVPASCQLLIGPNYSLLRPEFTKARQNLRIRNGEVRRLLVFYGGSDKQNETAKALSAIQSAQLLAIDVDVVVGTSNPNKHEIEKLCNALPRVFFHCQVDNMAELMASADLMLCAGGTTTWERCAVGLPGLVTTTAANQEAVADNSAKNGLSFYLGPTSEVSVQRLVEALRVLSNSPQSLQMFSNKELNIVDAVGVQRVVRMLIPPVIELRHATLEDCDAIHKWRNAEETRRYIFDQEEIPIETHRIWYRNMLDNPDRVLLTGVVDGKPIGILRYDITNDEALVSVYLVPGAQGQGFGMQLICSGSNWLRKNLTSVRTISAEILSANFASLRAFVQAGYLEHQVTFKKVLR